MITPPPANLTDDAIEDAVADEVCARIMASHPKAAGLFLENLIALYTAQAVGDAPPPGRIRDRQLAAYLGTSPQRISETRARALHRAWKAFQSVPSVSSDL